MNKVINITSNGIKQAIDDLVNENELLQDKVYKLESIIKEVREYLNNHIEQWNNVEEFINVVEEDEYILSLLDKENNNV